MYFLSASKKGRVRKSGICAVAPSADCQHRVRTNSQKQFEREEREEEDDFFFIPDSLGDGPSSVFLTLWMR